MGKSKHKQTINKYASQLVEQVSQTNSEVEELRKELDSLRLKMKEITRVEGGDFQMKFAVGSKKYKRLQDLKVCPRSKGISIED